MKSYFFLLVIILSFIFSESDLLRSEYLTQDMIDDIQKLDNYNKKARKIKNKYERAVPYWKKNIEAQLLNNKNIIVVAHGNSLRAILKYLFKISNEKIPSLEVPTGNPLLIRLDSNLKINTFNYLNIERSENII